jgi:hypothetical protein
MQFRMVFSARLVRLRYDQIVILRPSDGQRFVRIVDQDRLKQFAAATEFKRITDRPPPARTGVIFRSIRTSF